MKVFKAKKVERKLFPHGWKVDVGIAKNGEEPKFFPSHSFSRWANRFFVNMMVQKEKYMSPYDAPVQYTTLNITDYSNTVGTWSDYDPNLPWSQKLTYRITDAIGIGESNAAWDYNQYHLQGFKKWADGYVKRTDITETDSSIYFEFQGIFNITSSFNLWETGLYGKFSDDSRNHRLFLVSRDVLSSAIPVVSGDVIVVIYRFTVG